MIPMNASPLDSHLLTALGLISANPRARDIMPAGHLALNRSIPALLSSGLIRHCSGSRTGYRLTEEGRKHVG